MHLATPLFVLALAVPGHAVSSAPPASVNVLCEDAYLGVSITGSPQGGAQVARLMEGSPAEKAGLKVGDRILAFGDHKVDGPDKLASLVEGRKAGDKVTLHIVRGDKKMKLKAKLGNKAAAAGRIQAWQSAQGQGYQESVAPQIYFPELPTFEEIEVDFEGLAPQELPVIEVEAGQFGWIEPGVEVEFETLPEEPTESGVPAEGGVTFGWIESEPMEFEVFGEEPAEGGVTFGWVESEPMEFDVFGEEPAEGGVTFGWIESEPMEFEVEVFGEEPVEGVWVESEPSFEFEVFSYDDGEAHHEGHGAHKGHDAQDGDQKHEWGAVMERHARDMERWAVEFEKRMDDMRSRMESRWRDMADEMDHRTREQGDHEQRTRFEELRRDLETDRTHRLHQLDEMRGRIEKYLENRRVEQLDRYRQERDHKRQEIEREAQRRAEDLRRHEGQGSGRILRREGPVVRYRTLQPHQGRVQVDLGTGEIQALRDEVDQLRREIQELRELLRRDR